MSARYVYQTYYTNVSRNRYAETEFEISVTDEYNFASAVLCKGYTADIAYNRAGEPVAVFKPLDDGAHTWLGILGGVAAEGHDYPKDTSDYKYVVCKKFARGTDIVGECFLLEFDSSISGAFWHGLGRHDTIKIWNNNSSSSGDKTNLKEFWKKGGVIEKFGSEKWKTESANILYESGPYVEGTRWWWREYLGSDIIDPSAISYSSNDLYQEEPVTISVVPVSPKYGGTILYQYQYSINGGSTWIDAGSKTTETSKTIIIPKGAEQFQARVRASDGWGFTSKTYVTGPNLPVSQLKAYATVGGKLLAGAKIYPTIGGKIRQVQKGYVTVGGKVRKLF